MEKLKSAIIIILTLILGSCDSMLSSYKEPKYIKMADKINYKTIKNLKNIKELDLIGYGGSMMHNVEIVSLHFYYYHPASINEARNLILEITNNLISAFNSNEEIRPYLANYPFDEKNVEVSIIFMKKNNELQNPPSISSVSIDNGILTYWNDDPKKNIFVTIFDEPYEEAQKKVLLGADT